MDYEIHKIKFDDQSRDFDLGIFFKHVDSAPLGHYLHHSQFFAQSDNLSSSGYQFGFFPTSLFTNVDVI